MTPDRWIFFSYDILIKKALKSYHIYLKIVKKFFSAFWAFWGLFGARTKIPQGWHLHTHLEINVYIPYNNSMQKNSLFTTLQGSAKIRGFWTRPYCLNFYMHITMCCAIKSYRGKPISRLTAGRAWHLPHCEGRHARHGGQIPSPPTWLFDRRNPTVSNESLFSAVKKKIYGKSNLIICWNAS